MESETEYETEKHGDIDVYKATTNVTFSKEELEEAIRLYVEITEKDAERINDYVIGETSLGGAMM